MKATNGREASSESNDLWYYLAVLRRRWWLIVSTALIAFGMAWWTERGSLPRYTAEALLEQREPQDATSQWSFFRPDFGSHLDILRSAQVLSPVVDSLGLQLSLKNYRDQRTQIVGEFSAERDAPQRSYELLRRGERLVLRDERTGERLAEGMEGAPLEGPGFTLTVADAAPIAEPLEFSVRNFDVTLESLERRLRIEQGTGPALIWIRATDPDPRHAADVVNQVARAYKRHRASSAQETAGRRRRFIATQLASMADSLRAAQQNVIQYQENTLYDPNTEGNAVTSELLQADNRLRELRYQERLLSGLVAGLETSGNNDEALEQIMALGADLVPQGPQLSSRLQELQLRRAELTASRFGLTESNPQVQVVDSLMAETKSQARTAARQALELLRDRVAEEEARYRQLTGQAGQLPVRTAEYGRLQQRVEAVQQVFDNLVARYFEAQIAEGVEEGDIEVVAPADEPVWPDASYRSVKLGVGLIAGLMVGLVGALLVDQVDSRVRRPKDAERATNLEIVGQIPRISSLEDGSASLLLGKDAFRSLRTNLRFASEDPPRVVAVTSATPRDGKSTVASNLALTLADQGSRTLLVDADLRRPQVHTTFGLPQEPGVADVLLGRITVQEAVREPPQHEFLHVLTCGRGVESPTELVGSHTFEELLQELREAYDYVVLDTPPLLAATDSTLVAAVADGTLIVVRANRTDLGALETAVHQLRRLGVHLLGLVLNGVPTGRTSGYDYYPAYYPSYTTDAAAREGVVEKKRPLLQASGSDQRAS